MWVDAPQVGNFNDQKWGISVIAVTTAARAKRAWGTAAAGPVTARGAPPSRNDSG